MLRDCAFVSLCLCVFVLNGEAQVTQTERVDFPPGGLLRLNNSVGELTIEGWDLPEVEITTIKSTAQDPDRIRITAERRGNDVIVTTQFPRYPVFPPPLFLRSGADFVLEYRIKAPRNAGIVVNHDAGEVHIENMMGDVRVTVSKGRIALRLPSDESYTIDAKTDIGDVVSDFEGQKHQRPWIFGHRFAAKSAPAGRQLYLRVGFGDIAILKTRQPPYGVR